MNIIAGWMSPEMNCARKLDAYSASLCSSNVSAASRLPAEDLHQRVPGEHLLDVPVELAGRGPLLDELRLRPLADRVVTSTDTGTVTRAISASSGEIKNIMTSTPMTVSSE